MPGRSRWPRAGHLREAAEPDETQRSAGRGEVATESRTKAGSKLLQKKLLKGHPSVIKDILEQMEVELPSIMCDMHGNYLCSAAFQACSATQRCRMLEIAAQHLRRIATDQWGTHALQALIGLICSSKEHALLAAALEPHLEELSCDAHGAHVVQRALAAFGSPPPDAIVLRTVQCLPSIGHSPHGICVLRKCISQTGSGPCRELLLGALASRALQLSRCPYGNYAVQHALEEWGAFAAPIVQALCGHFVHLSGGKFSSKVVERALCTEPERVGARVFAELANPAHAQALMSTVYGHYVARQLLRCAPAGDQRTALERSLAAGVASLRNPRLGDRWEKVLRGDRLPDEEPEANPEPAAQRAHTAESGPRRRGQRGGAQAQCQRAAARR